MSPKAIAFVGLLLVGSGVLAGLMSVTSGGEPCGSTFFEATSAATDQLAGCDDVRNLVRIPVTVLITMGAVMLLAAFLWKRQITVSRG
ncbi:hypothetical protein ACIBG8_44830 [Nonomuraea sp. NPDC050556]|uniref:hypothetical protein n=1 Tax=Nonomuraea sp. NPDC050556 TaxID=3364369 RepID=UPI0037AC84C1